MIVFTRQERTVVSAVVLIFLFGTLARYALKKYPVLADAVNLIESDRIYAQTDINSASFEELVAIPYIGEYTARNIMDYRRQYGPFAQVEDIKKVKGIRDKNYEKFRKYIKVNL